MPNLKKVFTLILTVVIVGVSAFTLAEIYLRATLKKESKYDQIMRPRLWKLWSSGFKSDPFVPPYRMYANTQINNPERLKTVYESNKFPPNTDLESYDFLLKPELKEKSKYSIHFNNFGFRDTKDRELVKPKDTFRIIALGTYQTFGHGVNTENTYPAQLENLLNSKYKGKVKFEVWNGGRHAGSAIIGLARLKNEIMAYKPDLVLLDYGMVDILILGDDTFLHLFMLPDNALSDLARSIEQRFNDLFGESLVVMAFTKKMVHNGIDLNVSRFKSTMHNSINLLANNKIPVIVMDTNKSYTPPELYQNFNLPHKKSSVFYTEKYFSLYPPTEEFKKKFWSEENWTTEYTGDDFLKTDVTVLPNEYQLNIYQFNIEGLKYVAQGLSEMIEPHVNTWLAEQKKKKD